jgi:hypothetical protein
VGVPMVDAVYVETKELKQVVAIQPKPPQRVVQTVGKSLDWLT